MLTIVLCLWAPAKNQLHSIPNQSVTTYDYRHINIQYDMLERNISVPFRVILFTDEKDERIYPQIEQKQMWQQYREFGGCYPRIFMFSKEFKELVGDRFVHMDLSTIICDDITPILLRDEGDIMIYRNEPVGQVTCRMMGSFYVMRTGARADVYETFNANPHKAMEESRKHFLGTDQAWFNYYLNWREMPYISADDHVYNFIADIMVRPDKSLPDKTKMIIFTGPRDVTQPNIQHEYPWLTDHFRLSTNQEKEQSKTNQITTPKQDNTIYSFKLPYFGQKAELTTPQKDTTYLYKKGMQHRLSRLARDYALHSVPYKEHDIIIDVGAYIGEIGLFYKYCNLNVQYVAIEADAKAAQCCNANNGKNVTINKALWFEETSKPLYHNKGELGASLFYTNDSEYINDIACTTLSSIIQHYNIAHIKLLKIHAAGAENEVLEGAKDILSRIEYVVVNCSTKKGTMRNQITQKILNIMLSYNFSVREYVQKEHVFLFHNNAFAQDSSFKNTRG